MGKLNKLCSTLGSKALPATLVMLAWLDYTYRCVLIVASPFLLETRKRIRSIFLRNVSGELREVRRGHPLSTRLTRIYLPMDRYRDYPLLRFHSIKYIPLIAVAFVIAFLLATRHDPPITIEPVEPTTTIRQIPLYRDDFRRRWPSDHLPLLIQVRTERILPSLSSDNVERAALAPNDRPEPKPMYVEPTQTVIKPRYADTCTRHNMRKEIYNHGRSWRCRR